MFDGGGEGGFGRSDKNPEIGKHNRVKNRAEFAPIDSEGVILNMLKKSHERIDFMTGEFTERKDEIVGKIEGQEAHEVLGELMADFEQRHSGTEANVDSTSPESRIEYLLSLLIECGADWSSQKRKAVRRIVYNYASQSLARIKSTQLANALNEQLLQDDLQKEFGDLQSEESDLISSWLSN